MSEQQIHEIEINIEQAKSFVGMGESLEKLFRNRDFKKIVMDGYFKDEAIRLVHLKGDPSMQKPELQEAILRDIDAISALHSYFQALQQRADHARYAIEEGEKEIEELRSEDI